VTVAETVQWIDPDGATTTLPVLWDTVGRFSPPVRTEESGVPGGDGGRLWDVHHGPRDFVLPLSITGTSESDLRVQIRAMVSALNPKRGDGLIRISTPVGDQREIVCRAISGLEMSERLGDTSGPLVQRAAVVFRAWEPYWRDVSDTIAGPWLTGENPGSFFPIFPLRLVASEIFAAVSVDNLGDIETWPVWTITGPAEDIGLLNLTTGKTLRLTYTVLADEVITIDTRPKRGTVGKKITSTVAGNIYDALVGAQTLWSLQPGINAVEVQLGGATAATVVQMARRHLYLAA
jgi:hypothetical protein